MAGGSRKGSKELLGQRERDIYTNTAARKEKQDHT